MKTKFFNALSLAVIAAMLLTSLALADNVLNDVVAGGNDTIASGGSTTISYRIQQTGAGNDGQAGCNASDGSPVTVALSVPAGVTASTTSLTFNTCGDWKAVTFSSSTPGNYAINVSSIADAGTGSYSNQANFTLHVLAPPNTPPSVSVTGVTNGASYESGAVPAAGCSVVDAQDGNSTFAATLSAITGPLAAYGLGSQTASCSYTDGGGLSGSASATYSIVDTIAPVIIFVSRTAANGNGWNNGDVTVNWSCSDSGSGVVNASVSQTVSTEGANQSATGTCQDNAGNSASDTQTGINIDKTAPTASASGSPAPNSNGWNNTDVTVSFTGNDGSGSGIASCAAPVVLSAEGTGQSASGTCTDNAGNVSASASASGINIDKTAPTNISFVGGPDAGVSYYFGNVPAAPTCTADGAISGLASCNVAGYGTGLGSHTMTATATDNAGNSGTATQSYTVLAWTLSGFYSPVDMGVMNNAKGGSTVPLKFEVFAGSTELTSTSIVQTFTQKISCAAGTGDDIEQYATGGTTLRYDTTSGQFIFNWQTPKAAGSCYRVTLKTQDGTSIYADFRLK